MTEAQSAAMVAIVEGESAWSYAAALAEAGHCPCVMGELEAAGLVEPWRLPDGEAWILTPLGAYAARVRLEEGRDGSLSWIGAHIPEGPIRIPRHPREERLPFPELVPDPAPGPEYLIDEVSEQPVMLWGGPILIDPRLARRVHRRRGRRPA